MENRLQVKNLRVSFRTVNGKVQAVRDISFDLAKGETLAIVGESGSGKSVTSRAILGILAGNSIVEGGEILFDGQDLLKIPEDDFYKIRGDKIAMIFQDPLSSLNPIMRVGKQLTEAMILKGKARQKSSRKAFNTHLHLLEKYMVEALAGDDKALADELIAKCRNFDKFEFKHIELEQAYNKAIDAANGAVDEIKNILFLIEKSAFVKEERRLIGDVIEFANDSVNPYVVADREKVTALCTDLKSTFTLDHETGNYEATAAKLNEILAIMEHALSLTMPNFFAMGFYLTFATEHMPQLPVEELNVFLRKYLDDNFMLDFIANAEKAIADAAAKYYTKKEAVVAALRQAIPTFAHPLDKAVVKPLVKNLIDQVEDSIDRMEITKDSAAYTFASAIDDQLDTYFAGIGKNAKEIALHEKKLAKYNKLCEKGKSPDWKVNPPSLVDLDLVCENIVRIITRLADSYEEKCAKKDERNYHDETVAIIDYLKASASGVVYKVTRRMAKSKALKLMDEVGIPEPRRRYRQYPFEFSGGMRQRIVIAIALAANPDILICDEPTTALDVTIQSQILELINRIKEERNLSIIFITHDLGVVANMADRIAVMYAGKIVEYGTSEDIFYSPAHPYTWALLSSMPDLDTKEKLEAIPGTPPNMIYPPVGDAFADRNKYALQIDFEQQPPMFDITETHKAATWLLHPNAPKIDPPQMVTDRIERMKKMGGLAE